MLQRVSTRVASHTEFWLLLTLGALGGAHPHWAAARPRPPGPVPRPHLPGLVPWASSPGPRPPGPIPRACPAPPDRPHSPARVPWLPAPAPSRGGAQARHCAPGACLPSTCHLGGGRVLSWQQTPFSASPGAPAASRTIVPLSDGVGLRSEVAPYS